MDSLEKRVRTFFSQCRRNELPNSQMDGEFLSLRNSYYKVLEDSDEKVQLAGQMYDLVERYLRRLDSELYKFKCELEADHNGITEILEKRSLELDGNNSAAIMNNIILHTTTTNTTTSGSGNNLATAGIGSGAVGGGLSQKENRYFGSISSGGAIATNLITNNLSSSGQTQQATMRDYRYNRHSKAEKRRDSSNNGGGPSEKRQMLSAGHSSLANSNNNNSHSNSMPGLGSLTPIQQQQSGTSIGLSGIVSNQLRPTTPNVNQHHQHQHHHQHHGQHGLSAINSSLPLGQASSSLHSVQQHPNTIVISGNSLSSSNSNSSSAVNLGAAGLTASSSTSAVGPTYTAETELLRVAANQALTLTQQQQQGRRTASLKASVEAVASGGVGLGIGPVGQDILGLSGPSHNAIQVVEREANNANQRRHKK